MDAFASLNKFIDRRLEALVAILAPSAADSAVSSALNALATGATDFTCKAILRAKMAVPLIGRFARALLRCALEMGCGEWERKLLEATCSCLRMAFKSLDDALRIVASDPDGPTYLSGCDSDLTHASSSACCPSGDDH